MKLSNQEIEEVLMKWNVAWDNYDLDNVMNLFHEDVYFENWTLGNTKGKEALYKAWAPWFKNHGNFKFIEEETFIDEEQQKALYRWSLEWPSTEPGFEGKPEIRKGVDVLHFKEGKIIRKISYSKTSLTIDNKRIKLSP